MKKNTLILQILTGLMLAFSVCVTRADIPYFIYTFPGGANQFIFTNQASGNYNPPPYTIRPDWTNNTTFLGVDWTNIVWSTNNATLYTPGSGSAEIIFSNINSDAVILTTNADSSVTTNGATATFTMDLFNADAGSNIQVTAVGFDIMVDPGSASDTNNGFGFFQAILRDAAYTFPTNSSTFSNFNEELGNPTYNPSNNLAGTWEHILITSTNGLPDATHLTDGQTNRVRAITWSWYWGGHDIHGNQTCYIDNLVIYTNGTLIGPTMSISKYSGLKGVLQLITTPNSSVNQANVERQDLRAITITNSWVNSTGSQGTGPTTSYALTITNYPSAAYSNFQSYIFIASSGTGIVPTEPAPDWVEPNVMYFSVVNNADGSGTAQLLWKVSDPNDNNMFYGANGYSTGFLGNVTSPSPLGTWSMTFDHDTNITLTAPNGTTAVTNMPYNAPGWPKPGGFLTAGAIKFATPVAIYTGCEAATSNNIGQLADYSLFQIVSNGTTVFSDNFSGNSLDTTKWQITAEDPSGITQIPGYAAYLLSWTLPDVGYVLTTSTNLGDANSWVGTTSQPFPYAGLREAYAPSTNMAFYRLQYILTH